MLSESSNLAAVVSKRFFTVKSINIFMTLDSGKVPKPLFGKEIGETE